MQQRLATHRGMYKHRRSSEHPLDRLPRTQNGGVHTADTDRRPQARNGQRRACRLTLLLTSPDSPFPSVLEEKLGVGTSRHGERLDRRHGRGEGHRGCRLERHGLPGRTLGAGGCVGANGELIEELLQTHILPPVNTALGETSQLIRGHSVSHHSSSEGTR